MARNGLTRSINLMLTQDGRYMTNDGNTYRVKYDSNGNVCFVNERNGKLTRCGTMIADQDINGLRRIQ